MKVIGVFTEDFKFFYEVVRRLKERGEPFVSLGKGGEVPASVGVVLTSEEERAKVRFGKVAASNDPEEAINIAKCLLAGGVKYHTIVVGIDPGKRTGVALFGEGKLLATEEVISPELVPGVLSRLLRCLDYHRSIARVGHGDPTRGQRIIRGIWGMVDEVELVDETGTTMRTVRPDIDAAKRIAMTKGVGVEKAPEVEPTPGEIKDIQRLSRIESKGSVTITTELAESVALGKLTLTDAIARQRKLRAGPD
jgi:hypothetical protein